MTFTYFVAALHSSVPCDRFYASHRGTETRKKSSMMFDQSSKNHWTRRTRSTVSGKKTDSLFDDLWTSRSFILRSWSLGRPQLARTESFSWWCDRFLDFSDSLVSTVVCCSSMSRRKHFHDETELFSSGSWSRHFAWLLMITTRATKIHWLKRDQTFSVLVGTKTEQKGRKWKKSCWWSHRCKYSSSWFQDTRWSTNDVTRSPTSDHLETCGIVTASRRAWSNQRNTCHRGQKASRTRRLRDPMNFAAAEH